MKPSNFVSVSTRKLSSSNLKQALQRQRPNQQQLLQIRLYSSKKNHSCISIQYRSMSSNNNNNNNKNKLVLDSFALRQFNNSDPKYKGTRINHDLTEFENKVNQFYEENGGEASLKEGYVSNSLSLSLSILTITLSVYLFSKPKGYSLN